MGVVVLGRIPGRAELPDELEGGIHLPLGELLPLRQPIDRLVRVSYFVGEEHGGEDDHVAGNHDHGQVFLNHA